MSLQRCSLSWQAFTTCTSHAMSTEKQEVMGLLLGRWDEGRDGNTSTAVVDHAMILTRTDKQEDRVEVGYQQLAEASSIAERMSKQLGQPTRVVGWYHSHPHITVLPSHVDVRTQGQYQSMDRRFIGLIFSVFNDDKNSKVGTIEVTAFQAMDTSPGAEADAGEGAVARASRGPATWARREVALSLHSPGPGSSTTPLSDALERVVRLQDTLFGEERQAYLGALKQNQGVASRESGHDKAEADLTKEDRNSAQGVDLLSKLFCAAVYSKSLATLTGESAAPLAQTLRSQLNNLKNRAALLENRKNVLLSRLSAAELEKAEALALERVRMPCSAGIGAFQVHGGEQDIPRAEALRFARAGAKLRRSRLLLTATSMVTFKVYREYSHDWPVQTSTTERRSGSETGVGVGVGGGVWIVDMGGKKMRLVCLRAADEVEAAGWGGGGKGGGLVFETAGDGEIEVMCEDPEAFRMWLGVAAAVCPAGADCE